MLRHPGAPNRVSSGSHAMMREFGLQEETPMPAFARWTAIVAAVAALVAGGCNHGGGDSPPTNVPQVTIAVERVFPSLSFNAPVAMLQAPNDSTRWFVVAQRGVVHVFNNNNTVVTTSVFVDISGRVTFPAGSELGLLGMAFHPLFPTIPSVYLFYSTNDPNLGLASRISEFVSRDGGVTLDATSER